MGKSQSESWLRLCSNGQTSNSQTSNGQTSRLGRLGLGGVAGLAAIALGMMPALVVPTPAIAGTCSSNCGPKPLRFQPGRLIQVEVVNYTRGLVLLEDVQGSDAIPVAPSRTFRLTRRTSTESPDGRYTNGSVIFWDAQGLPLKATVKQPQPNVMRIELRPAYRPPGDRSIYLNDDGSISVL